MSALSRVSASETSRAPAADPSLLPKSGIVPLPVDPSGRPAFAESIRHAMKDASQPSRQPVDAGGHASDKNKSQSEPAMLPAPGRIAGSSPVTTSAITLKSSPNAVSQPTTMSPVTGDVGAVTESMARHATHGGDSGAASAMQVAGTPGSTDANSAPRKKTADNAASNDQNGIKATDRSTFSVPQAVAAIAPLPIGAVPQAAAILSGAITLAPASQPAGGTVLDGGSVNSVPGFAGDGAMLQQSFFGREVSAATMGQTPTAVASDRQELAQAAARMESAGITGSTVSSLPHANPTTAVVAAAKTDNGGGMAARGTYNTAGHPDSSSAALDASGAPGTTVPSNIASALNGTVGDTSCAVSPVEGGGVLNATPSLTGIIPNPGTTATGQNTPPLAAIAGTLAGNIPALSGDSNGLASAVDHSRLTPGAHPASDSGVSGVGSVENHLSSFIGGYGANGSSVGNLSSSNTQTITRSAPSDAFAALDRAASADPNRLLHVSSNQLAVGVADPHLGWVEVRTERIAGHVSAQLATDSAATHAELAGSLPAMTAYLHEQRVGVQTLAVAAQLSGGNFSGNAQDGSRNASSRGLSLDITQVGAASHARTASPGAASSSGWAAGEQNAPSAMVELRPGHQVSVRA